MSLRYFQLSSAAVALAGVCAAPSGCGGGGGGTRYPDASPFDAPADRRVTVDAAPRPAPAIAADSQLLIPGRALLIGSGPDSCSIPASPADDVWCGFTLPSAFLGLTDLWVIDVSQAIARKAAGDAVRCDGGDPDCLRLTSTLAAESGTFQKYGLHSFSGDTLIYFASDEPAGGNPAYAWRPGWATGKLLAADSSLGCGGNAKAAVAYCLGNIDQTTVAGQASVDIFAGAIGDGSTTLPKIATAIVKLDAEANVTKFQVGFSPAGDWIAWSARPTADGVETLNAQKVGDATTRQVIAADVSRWSIARDGLSWYWLKSYDDGATTGAPSGTLQAAPFPPGAPGSPPASRTLFDDVGAYIAAGDKGLAFLGGVTAGAGALTLMPDRAVPATVKAIDSGVVAIMDVAHDGSSALYSKTAAMDPLFGSSNFFFDLYLGGASLAAPCALSTTTLTPSGADFSPSGARVVWIKFDSRTGAAVGSLTDVAGCTSATFTSDLWFWSFAGADEGLIWTENGGANQSNTVDVTLKYGALAGGVLPAATPEIQQRVDLTYASLLPAYPAILYAIYVGAPDVDGLYIDTQLPFTATRTIPVADGGARDSAGDGARDGGADGAADGGARDGVGDAAGGG